MSSSPDDDRERDTAPDKLQPRSTARPSPSSSPARLRPLSSLPVEVQAEILSYCDPETLAVASRASFGFLKISSAHLYRDVNIIGPHQLRRFFCPSVSPCLMT